MVPGSGGWPSDSAGERWLTWRVGAVGWWRLRLFSTTARADWLRALPNGKSRGYVGFWPKAGMRDGRCFYFVRELAPKKKVGCDPRHSRGP